MDSEMKWNLKSQKTASEVEYKLETWAINYQLEMEEEILMQQLGLDRFLLVVAWYIDNLTVAAGVIDNFESLIHESMLNGKNIRIFQENKRRQIQSMFYLTPQQRDVETTAVLAKMNLIQLFPSV